MHKKIMFVTPFFPPSSGGVENYVYHIAKRFRKNWEVIVVTSNLHSKKIDVATKEGIKMYQLPCLFTISNTPINPRWYFDLKKIIHEEKPSLINAHAPVPFLADIAAVSAGSIPFILTYHAGTMKKGNVFSDTLITMYEKVFLPRVCRKAAVIICSSQYVRAFIKKKYAPKTTIVTPGVDTDIFKPSSRKKQTQPTVLFIAGHANMYKMKGLFYVIDAVRGIPGVALKIIGEKIDMKEEKVKFLGIKKGKELVKEIQQASMVVLPSLADVESFGMVLIEAMACKTPVIGTKSGGIPEIITDKKDGLLVQPGNTKALQQAIGLISHNKKLAEKLSENGYKKVKKAFTWEMKYQQTQRIFSQYLPQ